MNYQIKVIENWQELERLESSWDKLANSGIYHTIFQSFAWNKSWWQAYGHLYRPLILIAKHKDEVIGIAPFVINSNNQLELLGSPETEYQNLLINPEYAQVLDLLIDEIFKLKNKYKILLWEVPQVTPLSFAVKKYLDKKKIPYSTDITHSFQARISKKINKSDIRYRRNKLKKIGQVLCCSPADDVKRQLLLLDHFFIWLKERFDNSLSRYRQRQLSPEYYNFCKNIILNFRPEKNGPYAHMVELTLDGEVIAIDKTIRCDNMIYGLLQSYNPKYSSYSPGSILLQDSLNSWLEDGIVINDFLRGDEGYKMRFVNTSLPLVRFSVYSNKAEKQVAELKSNLLNFVKPVVFYLYDKFHKIKLNNLHVVIKKIIFWLVWYSGTAWTYQLLTKKRNRVLCYHSISDHPLSDKLLAVSKNTFERQIEYTKKLKTKSYKLEITFDDGYQDNYTNAWPILKEYGLKATVFPTIEFIEQGFIPSWYGEPEFPALTWEQIQAMHKSGLVEFGCHTLTHSNLAKLNGVEIRSELERSKEILEKKLQVTDYKLQIIALAYPFGKKENFNDNVKKAVKELGFRQAFTIEEGTNNQPADPYELKRIVIFDEPMYMFKVRVSGVLDDLLNLFNKT